MCRALAAQGVEPLIVATDADGDGRLDVPIAEPTTWDGVSAIFFKRDFSESFKYSRGLSQWLTANVRTFDVIHVHALMSHTSLAAAAAARRFEIPYVIRPLGTLAPWSLQQNRFRKRLLLMLRARQLLHGAAAIHCTSEQERRDLESGFGLTRCVVIPLGIDPAVIDEAPVPFAERDRDPYVLAVSRIHPKKNLETLIEAFLDVADSGDLSRWRLVVAGTGDAGYQSTLEALVRRRQGERQVTFAGWVDGDQKRQLIRHASVFALASLHENFGMSVLEAQAAGVPALISDHVDLAPAITGGRSGWVVAPLRSQLTEALAHALRDSTTRAEMGRAARTLASAYAWPIIAARLTSLYQATQPARLDAHAAAASIAGHQASGRSS
jgi:glycosyltransferase involved in cell wall biosynthesis